MHRRTVAVVALALLAGCSGVAPGGSGPAADTSTVTPAPVPTDIETETPRPQLAPGVGPKGSTDPFSLASTHDAILGRNSHVRSTNRTVRYANGTLRRQVVTSRADAGGGRYHQHIRIDGGDVPRVDAPVRAQQWSDGDQLLQRFESGDNVTYGRLAPGEYAQRGPIYIHTPDTEDRLYVLVSLFETRLADREDTGDRSRYRIASTGVRRPDALDRFVTADGPRNATFGATVTGRGLVASYRLAYEGEIDGTTVTVVRSASYDDIGTTTVERPTWYDRARNASGDVPGVPDAGEEE